MRVFAELKVLVAGLVGAVVLIGCSQTRLDENFCPIDETPPRTTVLLLDTSDPLSAEHESVLRRLVAEMYSLDVPDISSELYIAPGERLVVYQLIENVGDLEPVLVLCTPGQHPSTWPWWRQLIEGRAIVLRRWQLLWETIDEMFDNDTAPPQSQSPIIEAIGAIVPRYAISRRSRAQESTPIHLVLYSDLLQNSESLSHYGPYESAGEMMTTARTRHLGTDLAGVEVSIYRLERARDARWQTVDHFYWWTMLIQEFDGRVIYQESI